MTKPCITYSISCTIEVVDTHGIYALLKLGKNVFFHNIFDWLLSLACLCSRWGSRNTKA